MYAKPAEKAVRLFRHGEGEEVQFYRHLLTLNI